MYRGLAVLVAFLLIACGPPISPTPSPSASAARTASPNPVTGDPCHVNEVTYCVLNSDVTFATRGSTICVSGYTSTIRPPVSYTNALKMKQMQAEHLSGTTADYEEDHRLPLTGGGNPTDEFNLSPEPISQAHIKDGAEAQLGHDLCNANSEQKFRNLQAQFIQRWLGSYPAYK